MIPDEQLAKYAYYYKKLQTSSYMVTLGQMPRFSPKEN